MSRPPYPSTYGFCLLAPTHLEVAEFPQVHRLAQTLDAVVSCVNGHYDLIVTDGLREKGHRVVGETQGFQRANAT